MKISDCFFFTVYTLYNKYQSEPLIHVQSWSPLSEIYTKLEEGQAVYIIQKLQKSDKHTSKVPLFMPSCLHSFVFNYLVFDKKMT